MPRPKTWKLKTAKYGRPVILKVNTRLDISGFSECAGFAFLVMAANPHLSTTDIHDVLSSFGEKQWRSETWIQKRRWMFAADSEPLPPSDDGLDERARQIMRNNPRISARKMTALLRSNGIVRTIDWVYRSKVG